MRPSSSDAGHRRALVVELCGLPGCGKTTLARALVTEVRRAGGTAVVLDEPVSAAAALPRRLPRKVAMAARVVLSAPVRELATGSRLAAGQPARHDRAAVPLQWWLARGLVNSARRVRGTAVIEEGLVQALWSAGLLTSRATDVPRLVDLAAEAVRADLVVHVDVPVPVALHRLEARASRHSRVQRMHPDAAESTMHRGHELLDALLAEWRHRRLGEVAVVDGSAPESSTTAVLQDLVTEMSSTW